MTTTDQHNKLTQPADAGQNEHSDVVAFDPIKRRNRLDQLLFTRSHLASMAAQQRSHAMDEAHESFLTLCAVESQIRDEFPREYESSFARWLVTEVADEHRSGS